ncbi:hypothetical protein TNCV_3857691 [Trichonephila clavipes]|nr:hypothetical protein TNCV_3857691 [Trichonephila clavipes]
MIVQFRNEKVSNHGSIPITIDCNVVAFIVFEEGFHQRIKRTKPSVFLDVTVWCFDIHLWISFTPNAAALFVDEAIQPEVRFITKQNSLMKIDHYFRNKIAQFESVVQAGWKTHRRKKSACVEAGTTIFQPYYLRRGDISGINVFIGYIVRANNKGARKKKGARRYCQSTDTIVKLKTKIENSSTFESDPDFVKTLIQNCIDERVSQNEREVTSEQKIELAKLQLAKLEKEIELQLAKNKALSLNPAAKVEENSSKLT